MVWNRIKACLCDSVLQEILQPAVAEHPFDKVLSKRRITEPPFLLDRNQRKLSRKGSRKDSSATVARHPLRTVHTYPLDAATGRASLKDVSREVQFLECVETLLGHCLQRLGVIVLARDRHEPGVLGITHQPHRFTRGT